MHRVWRFALIAAATLTLVAGVPLLADRVSVWPAAALVRFEYGRDAPADPPAGLAAIRQRVIVRTDITVPVRSTPSAVLDVYRPRAPVAGRPVLLWAHGGGYLSGSRRDVADFATVLAGRGFVVASLEYSLAPEHRYPTPVEQGAAALNYLAVHASDFGGDPGALFVGGDSAGAQIASELAAVQTNGALAASLALTSSVRLKGVILFCGLYDMDTVGATGFPALRTFLWSYTGERDWMSYPRIGELSTTRQVTAAYPATYLTVGDADPFQPQARELESALRAHGVAVRTRYWAGANLGHEYQFELRTAAAQTVLADTASFLDGQRS